jgi:hypothetical protein
VAVSRLSGAQRENVLMVASELAAATGDPAAIRRLQQIVSDDGELRAMGITEPETIDRIQRKAGAALSSRGLQQARKPTRL